MASTRNVAVVLAAHGAPMVSIDINVAIPAMDNNNNKKEGTTDPQKQEVKIARIVEKNMLRPRDDAAVKTIERLRLLLGPPDLLKSRAAKKSRDELLSFCPSADLLDAEGKPINLVPQSDDEGYMTNEVAWKTAKSILLAANSPMPLTLPIKYNLPTVTNVVPPNVVFVGVPCVSTSITTMFAAEHELLYEWDISPNDPNASVLDGSNNRRGGGRNKNNNNNEAPPPAAAAAAAAENMEPPKILSTSAVLIPPPEALGKRLRFRVRINAPDSLWTEVESPIVQPTPRGFVPMPRWAQLKPKKDPSSDLRIVSYNILHDGFATSKRSRARLYPFASGEVLDMNYRRARIAQELMRYDGDIVGLQECGRSVFDGYLDPIMKSKGYINKLRLKNNTSREGVALLLKKERFEVEKWVEFTLNLHEIKKILSEEAETISAEEKQQLETILADPQLEEALQEVPSVALIAVVRDKLTSTDAVAKKLVIGNTHLYYHADGCHIRILQTFMITRRMEQIQRELMAKEENSSVGKVLLGDFNFTRTTGGYALVTSGKVSKEHHSWEKSKKYYWGVDDDNAANAAAGGGEAELEKESRENSGEFDDDNVDYNESAAATTTSEEQEGKSTVKKFKGPSEKGVALDLSIPSSTSYIDLFAKDKTLECTNYSLWFKAIIDHIFISNSSDSNNNNNNNGYFKSSTEEEEVIQQLLPTPSMDDLSQNIAIPSHTYPSDHIALVADVAVRK